MMIDPGNAIAFLIGFTVTAIIIWKWVLKR